MVFSFFYRIISSTLSTVTVIKLLKRNRSKKLRYFVANCQFLVYSFRELAA